MLKSFFDGSNKADSLQYTHLTLAALAGRTKDWRKFDAQWKQILVKHDATHGVHTTDAIALQNDFLGWKPDEVDALLDDCVTAVQNNAAKSGLPSKGGRIGLRPITATVNLKEFIKALNIIPGLGTPEENCSLCCVNTALAFGQYIGCGKYEFYFDRNEPFYGHLRDRMDSKRSRVENHVLNDILHAGESTSRDVPALQAADLIGWAVNNSFKVPHLRPWQSRLLLDVEREHYNLDYKMLTEEVLHDVVAQVAAWRLPRRRKPR